MIALKDIRMQVEAQGAELLELPIVDIRINSRGGVLVKLERQLNNLRTDHIAIEVVEREDFLRNYRDELDQH